MHVEPTNLDRARSALALMFFGDLYPPVAASVERLGIEPLSFLLSKVGGDPYVTAKTLAVLWVAKFDQSIDFDLIDCVIASRDKMATNWFHRRRVLAAMKKIGILAATVDRTTTISA